MSYMAQNANRVLTIAEEKAEEYAKMGYLISDEAGETMIEPENPERKVVELKEKLEEATLYAENADKRIAELEEENAKLRTKISELETKKTTSKSTKKADQEA